MQLSSWRRNSQRIQVPPEIAWHHANKNDRLTLTPISESSYRIQVRFASKRITNLSIKKLRTHNSGYIRCFVTKRPTIIRGGHVFFEVSNFSNNKYQVAVYEPTGLGKLASKLIEGDNIDIGISVSNNFANEFMTNDSRITS